MMSGAGGPQQTTLTSGISQRDRMYAAESNKGHTILFLQFTADDNSRTYLDYDDIGRCVDGLCQLYEQKLKISSEGKEEVSYDVAELFKYFDSLKDLGALV
jgi:hypothetical protein